MAGGIQSRTRILSGPFAVPRNNAFFQEFRIHKLSSYYIFLNCYKNVMSAPSGTSVQSERAGTGDCNLSEDHPGSETGCKRTIA